MTFRDHFSDVAGAYARHRPGYPDELYTYLATLCRRHRLAWDCGTGSGQAAIGVARLVDRVVATDASAQQLAEARPHPRVSYETRPADRSGLADGSVDLVTVAQALHWFDLDPFYREVERVLRPGGVLAAWCYQLTRVTARVDRVIDRFYDDVVGPYWPPEREHIDRGYATIPFPYRTLETPPFSTWRELNLDGFVRYLATWSAVRRYARERGSDPLAEMFGELAEAWGRPETRRAVRWPLALRVGRKPGNG